MENLEAELGVTYSDYLVEKCAREKIALKWENLKVAYENVKKHRTRASRRSYNSAWKQIDGMMHHAMDDYIYDRFSEFLLTL